MNYIKSFIFNSQKKASLLQEFNRGIKYFISNSMYKYAVDDNFEHIPDSQKRKFHSIDHVLRFLDSAQLEREQNLIPFIEHVVAKHPMIAVHMRNPSSSVYLGKLDPINPQPFVRNLDKQFEKLMSLKYGDEYEHVYPKDLHDKIRTVLRRREVASYYSPETGYFHSTSQIPSEERLTDPNVKLVKHTSDWNTTLNILKKKIGFPIVNATNLPQQNIIQQQPLEEPQIQKTINNINTSTKDIPKKQNLFKGSGRKLRDGTAGSLILSIAKKL